LDAAIEQVFEQHQAEPLFKGVPGKVPFPAVACVSVNEEVVHGIPGQRVLEDGDIVSIDTGCRINGWCGDAAVTHPVGEVSPKVRRLLDTTRETLALAIRLLGEKRYWSEVAEQMAELVRRGGYSVVEVFTGHGIGRSLHEPPSAPNYKTKQDDFQLRPGLVLAIEPMVNMGRKHVRCEADYWTQVTMDGLPSAHFEHTIALTRDGPRVLTGPPEDGEDEGYLKGGG
jgi:methionyl aminopeptidase